MRNLHIELLATILIGTSTSALALPTVDGKVDIGEYSFLSEIPGSPTDGTLWMDQDPLTKNLYMAIILPLDYVDNTYGVDDTTPPTHTHPSWGDEDKDHEFKQLLGSDKAEIELTKGGNSSTFKLDYIYEAPKDSNMYDSGHSGGDGKDDDGVVLSSATSLDYNLSNFFVDVLSGDENQNIGPDGINDLTIESPELVGGNYITADAGLSDWIFEIVYEFEIDGSMGGLLDGMMVLADGEFLNGFEPLLKSVHASPNKDGEFKDIIPPPPTLTTTPVPEPSTYALLGSMFMLIAAKKRKKALLKNS